MMHVDGYLDVLLVVDEGEHTVRQVADACGLTENEALDVLTSLEGGGFLACPAGRSNTDGIPLGFIVSPTGKRLLRFGFDERFKRQLAEQWGGREGFAC